MKTGVQTFIEKAIEGGYDHPIFNNDDLKYSSQYKLEQHGDTYLICRELRATGFTGPGVTQTTIENILLDPEAWEAVGKVEGWRAISAWDENGVEDPEYGNYKYKMHGLIDALIEGKTPESYLKQLFNL